VPVPRAFVNTMTWSATTGPFRMMQRKSATPFTAKPRAGSEPSEVCPPAKVPVEVNNGSE
jgi:hypothetical protein